MTHISEVNSNVAGNTNTATTRSRGWMLTINNPTFKDSDDTIDCHRVIQDCCNKWKGGYAIYQLETGANGTPHLQIFLHFGNQIMFNSLQKYFKGQAHIEAARDPKACLKYCSKDETRTEGPWEVNPDNRPEQGNRSDLDEIAKAFVKMDLKEFVTEYPAAYTKWNKGLKALKYDIEEHRKIKPTITWLWGLAGVGKTRYAREQHSKVYIKDGTQWWDGYDQSVEAIIIDDFDGRWPFRDLLRLLDRYEYQGQVKGGYVKINTPIIYITCEFPPEEYWQGNELDQVLRRLDKVSHIKISTERVKQIPVRDEITI